MLLELALAAILSDPTCGPGEELVPNGEGYSCGPADEANPGDDTCSDIVECPPPPPRYPDSRPYPGEPVYTGPERVPVVPAPVTGGPPAPLPDELAETGEPINVPLAVVGGGLVVFGAPGLILAAKLHKK